MFKISKETLEKLVLEKSTFEIAEMYKCNIETIRSKIRKFKIERSRISHLMNEHFFKTWSHDMAYILGFTMADGYVKLNDKYNHSCITYELHRKDIEILEYIRDKIYPTKKIYFYTKNDKRTKKEYQTCHLTITGKIISKDLINLGCVQAKTYSKNFKIPDIPNEYRADFVRGYFDGDGTIAGDPKWYVKIVCNNKTFLYNILNIIKIGKIKNYKSDSGLTSLIINSKENINNFYNFIYNGNFYLRRKKERFDICLNETS